MDPQYEGKITTYFYFFFIDLTFELACFPISVRSRCFKADKSQDFLCSSRLSVCRIFINFFILVVFLFLAIPNLSKFDCLLKLNFAGQRMQLLLTHQLFYYSVLFSVQSKDRILLVAALSGYNFRFMFFSEKVI